MCLAPLNLKILLFVRSELGLKNTVLMIKGVSHSIKILGKTHMTRDSKKADKGNRNATVHSTVNYKKSQ